VHPVQLIKHKGTDKIEFNAIKCKGTPVEADLLLPKKTAHFRSVRMYVPDPGKMTQIDCFGTINSLYVSPQ
jgi:hypothetical protein